MKTVLLILTIMTAGIAQEIKPIDVPKPVTITCQDLPGIIEQQSIQHAADQKYIATLIGTINQQNAKIAEANKPKDAQEAKKP